MKFKKALCLGLVGIMVLATGCSSKTSETTQNTTEETKTEGSADSTDSNMDYSKKLTITVNTRESDKQNKDARYDFLKEKFNVDLKIISSGQDVKQQARIWVAGGDIPDVMWTNFDMSNMGEVQQWAESEIIRPFPSLENYPNLKALRADLNNSEALQINGEDYVWPAQRMLNQFNNLNAQGFFYRKDWADKLGMAKDSYTWEEMTNLAKAMAEQDPGENGKDKTIGLATVGWAFPTSLGMLQYNQYWNTYYNKDGKYVWGGSEQATIDGLVEMKRLYDNGTIWKDQPISQSADSENKFKAGQVGIMWNNWTPSNIDSTRNSMMKANPNIDIDNAFVPMKVISPNGSQAGIQTQQFYGMYMLSSNISDEKLDRFMAMQDYIASDEGHVLQALGIENQDYKNENGNITVLWEKDENGNYASPYVPGSDNFFSMTRLIENDGYTDPFNMINPKVKEYANTLMNNLLEDESGIAKFDYKLAAFNNEITDQYATIGSDQKDTITQLLISSTDIAKDYEAWVLTQQEKIDIVLDNLNENLVK